MSKPAASDRVFLKDKAYEHLKSEILTGKLAADTFLSERLLVDRLEMGKAPIRDAVGRLRQEGYLEVVPQQGMIVRGLSLKNMQDTFEARSMVEPIVVFHLAGRLPRQFDHELGLILADQKLAVSEENIEVYARRDVDFHLTIAKAYGNEELSRMLERSCERTFRAIFSVVNGARDRMLGALNDHENLLLELRRGNGEACETIMKNHIAGTQQLFSPGTPNATDTFAVK
ncbi:MAG: GntR family transcriptional regulator [Fuerstiella sp.]